MNTEDFPQYLRIALHLALRITEGELEEGQKISGRTKLSSEYSVSAETIRKALRLLSDMKVVEIREQSGVIVLSRDNARRYLKSFREKAEVRSLRQQLRSLMQQHAALEEQMIKVCQSILEAQEMPVYSRRDVPIYEVRIPAGSDKIGRNLASLKFWQATGATIVAIRRGSSLIISPGPYAELYDGDCVLFTGSPETEASVRFFLCGEEMSRGNTVIS